MRDDAVQGGGEGSQGVSLSREDALALDALVENAWRVERVPAELRARAERLASLLGLCAAGEAGDPGGLCDVAFARVVRARGDDSGEATLSGDDAEALDAWMLSGQDVSRVPGSLRPRAAVLSRLGELVRAREDAGRSSRDALIDSTLSRVEATSAPARAIPLTAARARLADVLSVAAMLAIGASLVWPVLAGVRARSERTACEGNLAAAGVGLGAYATDHRDVLPVASVFDGKRPWSRVGVAGESNSENLFTLHRAGYTPYETLACAGNARAPRACGNPGARDWTCLDEVSFSYRVMSRPLTLAGTARPEGLVLVSDRSPVFVRARMGVVFPMENSPNHRGAGQNALLGDGSVRWLGTPVLAGSGGAPGDNLWLPRNLEQAIEWAQARARGVRTRPLEGNELPGARADQLVGP